MNIYYLAGKLHTEQTIKQARAYHDSLTEERVIINGEPTGALGIVLMALDGTGFMSGRKGQRAQVTDNAPPRIYGDERPARLAVAAMEHEWSDFSVRYVHIVEVGK